MPKCERCHERVASVFITKIVNNETTKHRLCEICARERANELGGGDMSLGDIVQNLFQQAAGSDFDLDAALPEGLAEWSFTMGEFPADEEAIDDLEELERSLQARADDEFPGGDGENAELDAEIGEIDFDALIKSAQDDRLREREQELESKRCPKCSMTWDRLRQDGRAGCPSCYAVFEVELNSVMERSQRGTQHNGKTPRTAEKRRRRLAHLRARRDHQLELLQRRLQECVSGERFEEAARLRDKIRVVSSTIVSD